MGAGAGDGTGVGGALIDHNGRAVVVADQTAAIVGSGNVHVTLAFCFVLGFYLTTLYHRDRRNGIKNLMEVFFLER